LGRIILNEIGYGGLSGPAAGDRIYVDKILSEGTHIADLIVNDITTPLYAPPGAVNDVMVRTTGDYVSVLDSHGNGKVDLSDLYSNKQDKLTAGDNIKILNNTISASKTNVSVTANYSTGVNLCSITIDGTTSNIYIPSSAIAGVSGVTLNGVSTVDPTTNVAEIIVEPNPNDTATDSLTKLKISNTTYAVAATDEKVTQTETTTDADYELLFSETADNTTRTEGARKSENLLYNPNDVTLTVGATTGMTIDGNNGDINLIGSGDTWDGTYTSLKDAIANAGGGGGSSDLEAIEITQAAYDELDPTQKLDKNKIYFIKDAGGSGGGGGTTVIANPTGTPTDELKKLQVENIIYQVDKSEESRIYLFKDGQWQNTDILQFASHGCTIANNKLTFLGDSVGVCVSDVSGLAGQGINSYRVVFKIIDIPSDGIGIQAGRCYPTTDEYNIINTGANRISYTNDTYSEGITYLATVNATSNTEGVFFGAGYATPSTNYSIEAIYMDINQTIEKSYN
jgi:hypothetical protein